MSGRSRHQEESPGSASSARHAPIVERVIAAMYDDDGALRLATMAEMANLSPYHFARTFRQVTGVPPGEFLTAVRLERAKKLLLGTEIGVADVCFEVGYASVGTFATRFKELVGLPPGEIRRLPERLHEVLERIGGEPWALSPFPVETGVSFHVQGADLVECLIFVGLFPTAVPQGRPVAGTIVGAPGSHHLHPVPDGRYFLMAAALPRSRDPWELLAPGDALRVGRAPSSVIVRCGRANGRVQVVLRPVRLTDPPVLVALPLFLLERLTSGRHHQ